MQQGGGGRRKGRVSGGGMELGREEVEEAWSSGRGGVDARGMEGEGKGRDGDGIEEEEGEGGAMYREV